MGRATRKRRKKRERDEVWGGGRIREKMRSPLEVMGQEHMPE